MLIWNQGLWEMIFKDTFCIEEKVEIPNTSSWFLIR